jgi:cytochrome c peroxidase
LAPPSRASADRSRERAANAASARLVDAVTASGWLLLVAGAWCWATTAAAATCEAPRGFGARDRVAAGDVVVLYRTVLRADPFNLLGPHSDDASRVSATKTRHVDLQPANFGQFRTPSLRNASLTAPYMHDGRYATLREVVRHYSELDMDRLHLHGEQLLRPLKLSDAEIEDLVAFLETLTDPRATTAPEALPSACPP